MDTSTTKDKLAKFGRFLALLFNRGMMYQKSHPVVKDTIQEVQRAAEALFATVSPLVFILNREQFYIDEEPLDPRINVKRIAGRFKNHGIQSISFEKGLTTGELEILVDIFSSISISTKAETIRKELNSRGAYNVKVNHVLYRKVTEDDQVISRDALKKVTPAMEAEDSKSRKKFMETLLETILTEEFANTLNIKSLLANPTLVTKNMIAADNASAEKIRHGESPGGTGEGTGKGGTGGGMDTGGINIGAGGGFGGLGSGGLGPGDGSGVHGAAAGASGAADGTEVVFPDSTTGRITGGSGSLPGTGEPDGTGIGGATGGAGGSAHGPMLIHQLEVIQTEVDKHLEGESDVSLESLADAVFDMKKQLLEEIQTQKALGIAYANENAIVRNINHLTDQVVVKLVEEEYQAGKITTQRLAQIILRLIPDARDLRRLLPRIRSTLLEAGMAAPDYLNLVEELKRELQNEELSRIIEESSEAIGVDSDDLIGELKERPDQAAKLIYLASEIRKGTGDESALADILVDYVEQLGGEAAKTTDGNAGDDHLEDVVSNVESTVLRQLAKLDVGNDVMRRMEERINSRMESIMDRIRAEWLNVQAAAVPKAEIRQLTVLQTLEHNVGEDEELVEILKIVRTKVAAGELEENDYSRIHAEIEQQKKKRAAESEGVEVPEGVLSSGELMFILEKEIARCERYHAPFSALAFSFVSAKPNVKALKHLVTAQGVMTAALEKMANTIREVDYIGQIGKNKLVALLPMIAFPEAKKALSRVMHVLHAEPLEVHEVPVQLRVAGVVSEYDAQSKLSAQAFARQISNQLMDMVSRLKNIQVLF